MITADRFIETSDNYEAWLAARLPAITATTVAKAATPSGFTEALNDRLNPGVVEPNDFMRFGSANEDWIARVLKRDFGVMPNHWLIAAKDNPLHLATPDGLSLDHTLIAEIKTGGKVAPSVPIQHRRQMQWQMYVTGTEECVYAFMLRAEVNGQFVPAWMEPKTVTIQRDEKMIAELVQVADRLLNETKGLLAA